MSDSDDSETAEWEKEQMLRGTQSRGQKFHQSTADKKTSTINIATTKELINQDIERVKLCIESIKKSIGSTKVELITSEKRAEAIRKSIEQFTASNSLFSELGTLEDPLEVAEFLEKHKVTISKLPHDQRELINSLI